MEGWLPSDPSNPNNGQQEKELIVWRKLKRNDENWKVRLIEEEFMKRMWEVGNG
ncbi:MAG: hypothetical protein KAT62_04150 [Desulfuromonadales bacterium]|nr:hypothetical protein [Desulfuromonadales bacterium]